MMGEGIRMVGPTEVEEAARSLHDALAGTGRTVATAESLTGGDVGGAICTIAGASEYYLGGVISYASAVKAAVLGVDRGLLERCGSVDAEVAVQMAAGTARVCGADYGVSTTGVAGPEPHDGKPVGTVFIGVFGPAGSAAHERHYTGIERRFGLRPPMMRSCFCRRWHRPSCGIRVAISGVRGVG